MAEDLGDLPDTARRFQAELRAHVGHEWRWLRRQRSAGRRADMPALKRAVRRLRAIGEEPLPTTTDHTRLVARCRRWGSEVRHYLTTVERPEGSAARPRRLERDWERDWERVALDPPQPRLSFFGVEGPATRRPRRQSRRRYDHV